MFKSKGLTEIGQPLALGVKSSWTSFLNIQFTESPGFI